MENCRPPSFLSVPFTAVARPACRRSKQLCADRGDGEEESDVDMEMPLRSPTYKWPVRPRPNEARATTTRP